MIIIKRLELFPIIFSFKKYRILWRRIGSCCNLHFYSPKFWVLIQFAFKDYVYWRCPQCGKRHKIKLSYHVEESWDKDLREENKLLRDWK